MTVVYKPYIGFLSEGFGEPLSFFFKIKRLPINHIFTFLISSAELFNGAECYPCATVPAF